MVFTNNNKNKIKIMQEELNKQAKINEQLFSNIEFLTGLLIEPELKNELLRCPNCKSVRVKLNIKPVNGKKYFSGEIKCLECETSTIINYASSVQNIKKEIQGWFSNKNEALDIYNALINQFINAEKEQSLSIYDLAGLAANLTKVGKYLNKNKNKVAQDVKDKKGTD